MIAVESVAFQTFQNSVVEKFQKYLLEEEVQRFKFVQLQETNAQAEDVRARAILDEQQHVDGETGSNRYNQMGQVGGRRVIMRVAEHPNDPRFTSTRRDEPNVYGARQHFQRIGMVTNPIYTKHPDTVRNELQDAIANVLTSRDIVLPGAQNIPQSQYEINMQSRARYTIGNSKKYDRGSNAQLSKGSVGQRVEKFKQIVQASRPSKGFDIGTSDVLVNADTATQKINPAPRGYMVSTDAPKQYSVSGDGAARSVYRPLATTIPVVEPQAIITKKFIYGDAGHRIVVKREEFAKEGQGALDVIAPVQTVNNTRHMPDIQHVIRPTAKWDRNAHHDALITNEKDPVMAKGFNFVTRAIKNTEHDGLLTTNEPALDGQFNKPITRPDTSQYFRGIDQRGITTMKNPNLHKGRVPLGRMVQNPERF